MAPSWRVEFGGVKLHVARAPAGGRGGVARRIFGEGAGHHSDHFPGQQQHQHQQAPFRGRVESIRRHHHYSKYHAQASRDADFFQSLLLPCLTAPGPAAAPPQKQAKVQQVHVLEGLGLTGLRRWRGRRPHHYIIAGHFFRRRSVPIGFPWGSGPLPSPFRPPCPTICTGADRHRKARQQWTAPPSDVVVPPFVSFRVHRRCGRPNSPGGTEAVVRLASRDNKIFMRFMLQWTDGSADGEGRTPPKERVGWKRREMSARVPD
jgi:hypothetical protein